MNSDLNATTLELFIKGQLRSTSNTEYKLRTKCAHIFHYENGTMVGRNPKHSDYLKAIEFVKKYFIKAVRELKKKNNSVDWSETISKIDIASSGREFIFILNSIWGNN